MVKNLRCMMQRIISISFILIVIFLLTSGCSSAVAKPNPSDFNEKAIFGDVVLNYRAYGDYNIVGEQGQAYSFDGEILRNVTISVEFFDKNKQYLRTESYTIPRLDKEPKDFLITIPESDLKMEGNKFLSDSRWADKITVSVDGKPQHQFA